MENTEYQRKKIDDLYKRLGDAFSSIYHVELVSFLYVAYDNFEFIRLLVPLT